jgi:hypothetical protein
MNEKNLRLEKDVAVAEAYAAYLFALILRQRAKSTAPLGERRESGGSGPSTSCLPHIKAPD